ncbi:MAG: hypothetical protein FWG42_08540 [Clostridiales bacterium]|nr:hypothetical protein [Clostridiales bacterium]
MNNKKGSAIAEAAIVFPMVIVVVLTVVYILIAMYTDASTAARDHLALRHESGTKTETVDRAGEYRQNVPEDKFGARPFMKNAEISQGSKFLDKLLLTEGSRVYVVDEAKYVRRSDFFLDLATDLATDFVNSMGKETVNSNEKD